LLLLLSVGLIRVGTESFLGATKKKEKRKKQPQTLFQRRFYRWFPTEGPYATQQDGAEEGGRDGKKTKRQLNRPR
jgi:hypothetical protein